MCNSCFSIDIKLEDLNATPITTELLNEENIKKIKITKKWRQEQENRFIKEYGFSCFEEDS